MKKTYVLSGSAVGSYLLSPLERLEVESVKTFVTLECRQMGKINRNKMTRSLFNALREKVRLTLPVYVGVKNPVGGMVCGEPKEVL